MIVVYAVEVLRNTTWERWGWYLSKRLAEGVRLRREQEGLGARVATVMMDYAAGHSEGLSGEPMRCLHCHHPEGVAASCLPGFHHGYVTRRPGESSGEAERRL